jgi:hypothetical protein
MANPSPLPLLPDDGRGFLDGSIEADVYLKRKREQARETAISEIDQESPFKQVGPPATLLGLVIALASLGFGVVSLVAGDRQIGVLAVLTALLVAGVTALLFQTKSLFRARPNSLDGRG